MSTPAAIKALANGDIENFFVASTPGGIEAQEEEGQQSFVASETLPRICPREELESLGFVFGEFADDLFINVEMPKGWSKKATEHSMHSNLIDDKGRIRGGIFYKAAFYDQRASMHLSRRFGFGQNYDLENWQVQYLVGDCNKTIFETDIAECVEFSPSYWAASDKAELEAKAWLENKYPDWESTKAYWD